MTHKRKTNVDNSSDTRLTFWPWCEDKTNGHKDWGLLEEQLVEIIGRQKRVIHDFGTWMISGFFVKKGKKWNEVQLALHLSNIYGLPFRKEDQQSEEVTSFAFALK